MEDDANFICQNKDLGNGPTSHKAQEYAEERVAFFTPRGQKKSLTQYSAGWLPFVSLCARKNSSLFLSSPATNGVCLIEMELNLANCVLKIEQR